MNPKSNHSIRRGFTLVELLVVIGIIGLLVGITIPVVQQSRETARRTHCSNNLRQITLGLIAYESANRKFPAGLIAFDSPQRSSSSWLLATLPYVEQDAIYEQSDRDYRLDPVPFASHLGMRTVVEIFQCPSDPASGKVHWTHHNRLAATTNYLGVNGTDYKSRDGIFYTDSATQTRDITDGLSNTLMLGERPPSVDFWYGWWYAGNGIAGSGSPDMLLGVRELNDPPADYLGSCPPGPYGFERGNGQQCDTLHYWSHHPGGANFAMADGSVRLIAYDSDHLIPALATRSGGETASLEQ